MSRPSDGLETHVRGAPPLVVLELRGEVTTVAQEPLAEAYRRAATLGAQNVLLDFAGVDDMNSGGIAAIIGIIGEARRANQHVLLTGLTPHYQMVFDTMGLTAFAPMFDSEAAALKAVEAT
jgi:anti-anti-sigma factor